MTTTTIRPRWEPYVLHADRELAEHWKHRAAEQKPRVAFICGRGFDPRMCLGLEMLATAIVPEDLHIYPIDFGGSTEASTQASAQLNAQAFDELTAALTVSPLSLAHASGIEQRARGAVQLFADLMPATDIVIDINALPRSVFFPLITKLLHLCDKKEAEAPALHVLAGDAAWLDALIEVSGFDEQAVWLHPFEGEFLREANNFLPHIWMPVLGEGEVVALRRVEDHVKPDEVCPLLPFPSRDPRRGDLLFERYREVLFDDLLLDAGPIRYAAEGNPFQVYRRLRESTMHYSQALEPLEGCKIAYSALSSKLVALGVLLVAYETRGMDGVLTGVADIGAQSHSLNWQVDPDRVKNETRLMGLTLSGEYYV